MAKILEYLTIAHTSDRHFYSEVPVQHVPVMLKEVVEFLRPSPGKIMVDATIGCGGHARPLLERIRPQGRLIGIDQDQQAIEATRKDLKEFSDSLFLVYNNFKNLTDILKSLEIERIDGILFDLGVSSLQLDTDYRGFSLKYNAPLDMRMDARSKISAFELINTLPFEELSNILRTYGEERFHARIARAIVERRKKSVITTTGELSQIVIKAQPVHRFYKIHPATRTFQAFRIAVNNEIDCFRVALEQCIKFLNPGARICVLAYHSLEDRVAKHSFRHMEKQGQVLRLHKKPLRPSQTELAQNPRARSAKLRVAEKTQ